MFDLAEFFDGFRLFGHAPMGVFTFVVLLALIGGISSWLKVRAVQETVREAVRAGTPLTPETIRELKGGDAEGGAAGGPFLTGLILLAVAAALLVFGLVIGRVGDDEDVLFVFAGIAAFPGLIGVAFLASAALSQQAAE